MGIRMESMPYLLSDAARLLRRSFDARVRQLGVTSPQARLMLYMSADEGENQGYFAEKLEVEPITLCRMVDRMEETGLVERRKDPADRRAWRLYLTRRSRAMIEQLRPCLTGLEDEMLAEFNETDRANLRALLGRIQANLSRKQETELTANG